MIKLNKIEYFGSLSDDELDRTIKVLLELRCDGMPMSTDVQLDIGGRMLALTDLMAMAMDEWIFRYPDALPPSLYERSKTTVENYLEERSTGVPDDENE